MLSLSIGIMNSNKNIPFVRSLIFMGYKKNLEENDMWLPNERDVTRNSTPKFEKCWNEELVRCER